MLVPMTIVMKKMVSVKLQQKIVPIMIYVLLIIVQQLVIVDILTFLAMITTHAL
jgi:membrane-associated protease RseP (regulator of RpoE activity)